MQLTKMNVIGFRSLKENVEIEFEKLTMLIGCNDSGKSSILDILEIALNESKIPDENDYYRPIDGEPIDKIEVTLELKIDPGINSEISKYALDGVVYIKREYTANNFSTYYQGEVSEDDRLTQDFDKMSANEQKDLIQDLDSSQLTQLTNKSSRADWLRSYLITAPKVRRWVLIPNRVVGLPKFDRYSTMDYKAPELFIERTLKQIYESVIYDDIEVDGKKSRKLVLELQKIETQVDLKVQEKIQELKGYISTYNNNIHNISYDPKFDFSGGLRPGKFLVDDGRGPTYLAKGWRWNQTPNVYGNV
jgi:energy-coupling factor transporter ATP-binding protein EcfA2